MKIIAMKLAFVLLLLPQFVAAGVAAGSEVSGRGERTFYLAALSEGLLHYGAFFGQEQYSIDNKTYMHGYMAGGVGYRWYGSWTTNVILGLENSRFGELGQAGSQGRRFTGLYAQLALMKFSGDKNLEYLLAYSEDSGQLWSRLRLKFYTPGNFLFGPEVFAARFLETDTLGAGVVMEKVIAAYTIAGKLGFKDQSGSATSYAGLEFYRTF